MAEPGESAASTALLVSLNKQSHLNVASTSSIQYTSMMSRERSLASLSPKARDDIEQDMRITESQQKIVFRDFAVPVHNGRGKVDLKTLIKTQPGTRAGSNLIGRRDIISNTVQTTLDSVDEKNNAKQEKIKQLQKEVASTNGNIGHKKR